MEFSDTIKTLSHHAYVLVGNADVREELLVFLNTHHGISPQANPDFFDRSYETFTIDDARELKAFHATRPFGSSGKKIMVVHAHGVTSEAQNALLKLLEEPAAYAHFFLIVPSSYILLPTVLSRVLVISHHSDQKSVANQEMLAQGQAFVTMSVPMRLDFIKKLVEDISKEKKSKQDAADFLNALETSVRQKQGVLKGEGALETIEKARSYMTDRAPSVKMLLEFVAMQV